MFSETDEETKRRILTQEEAAGKQQNQVLQAQKYHLHQTSFEKVICRGLQLICPNN